MQDEDDLNLEWDTSMGPDPATLDPQARKEYWWSRTPEERLRETERLRRLKYGYKNSEKIKRVLKIIDVSHWK